MKSASSKSSTRTIVAILLVAVLAFAFWTMLLSPKREEAATLGKETEELRAGLSQAQSEVAAGEAARREFATNYQQLVVLGKAVPDNDETASLLVQLNGVANNAKVKFESLQLGTPSEASGGEEAAEPETAPAAGEGGEAAPTEAAPTAVPPTEAAASLSPLGTSVGPAGLSILPYNISFKGNFFHVADFIDGIDSLILPEKSGLAVDGRLVTLDGFVLTADADFGFPRLNANFSVTTYLVPPDEGLVGGASPTEPAVPGEVAPTETSVPTSPNTEGLE